MPIEKALNRQKKILIVNPGALFPIIMASQDRVVEMIKRLSKDHVVDVATIVRSQKEIDDSINYLNGIVNKFYPIMAINRSKIQRVILGVLFLIQFPILSISKRYFYWGGHIVTHRLSKIIKSNNYDIVQIEHWYQGRILSQINPIIKKVVASHDILYEKKELEYQKKFGNNIPSVYKKELKQYKTLETKFYRESDIVISISNLDAKKIRQITPDAKHITIPIGKDLDIKIDTEEKSFYNTILFYGSLSGEQNIIAFTRLYKNIYPIIKESIPDVRLLVVGADPPVFIKNLHNNKNIIVTGYVERPYEFFRESDLMIIPLETGGGFRGRITEVLAAGIPVIGTHNALDCVEIEDGVHGFITDNDSDMAIKAISIMQNISHLSLMRKACTDFVKLNYSIEATYGKLSKFYQVL